MTRMIPVLLLFLAAVPAPVLAQGTQGRGALRPYFYVFLAYGLVWVIIGFWVFLIARRLGRLERHLQGRDPSTSGG